MEARYLKLIQIYQFVHGTLNSRNMIEGEAVLKAGQVVLVGCTTKTDDKIQITGIVLQTSALSSLPHKIEGTSRFFPNSDHINIEKMICSCKAGQSGSCKHVVATLLYMERNNILELEDLSCTELKCSWKTQKSNLDDHFSAVPVHKFCCAKEPIYDNELNEDLDERRDADKSYVRKPPFEYRDLDENMASEIVKLLCEAAPASAISLHIKGRGTAVMFNECENRFQREAIHRVILNSQDTNDAVGQVYEYTDMELVPCCVRVLTSLRVSDPVELCYNTAVNRSLWMAERKLRVTGSRIYDMYTYVKNRNANWTEKAHKFFCPYTVSNKYTKHGLLFEDAARERYVELFEETVVECGLVVHPLCPWLGYSPDGVIFEDGKPMKLLEIKCFYEGKNKSIAECLPEIPYLNKTTGLLRVKHKYYGQIQLGMLLLNLQSCNFVIYASFDKSVHVVNVPFDQDFAVKMANDVTIAYLTHMLHYKCLKETGTGQAQQ